MKQLEQDDIIMFSSELEQPKDRGLILKDILQENPNPKHYISDKKYKFIERNNVKIDLERDKSHTLSASFHKQGKQECTNLVMDKKYYITKQIINKKEGTLAKKKAFDNMRNVNQKSKTLTAGGQNISNSGATNVIVDDKYYLKESNLETIKKNIASKGKEIDLSIDNSLIEKMTYPSRIKQKKGNIKCPTLTAAMGTGGGNVPVIVKNLRIRKLTEIECERLQNLEDNYTEGISMTQRYKALGNGWTIDVLAHIFKNILI